MCLSGQTKSSCGSGSELTQQKQLLQDRGTLPSCCGSFANCGGANVMMNMAWPKLAKMHKFGVRPFICSFSSV